MSDPKLRRQSHPSDPTKDRAFVVIDGRRNYLGRWGAPETKSKYHRLLAEKHAGVPVGPPALNGSASQDWVIVEVIARYQDYLVERVTRPKNYDYALGVLAELYGMEPVRTFGSERLIAIQEAMIRKGWTPRYVNKNVARLKRMFKWGVPRKLVPAPVYGELALVESLPATKPNVTPAPVQSVEKVRLQVSRQIRALIDLQLLTGARPGELCIMRLVDIDTSKPTWEYRPTHHKTEKHGKDRVIYLGPKAQTIVRGFLTDRRIDAFLFSPREAVAELRSAAHAKRKTPLSWGNRPGTNRVTSPERAAGDHYTTISYAQAVRRACRALKIPEWSPNQLRHSYATRIRAEFGIDVASTLLGHSKVETTQIYAEQNHAKAQQVIAAIG